MKLRKRNIKALNIKKPALSTKKNFLFKKLLSPKEDSLVSSDRDAHGVMLKRLQNRRAYLKRKNAKA